MRDHRSDNDGDTHMNRTRRDAPLGFQQARRFRLMAPLAAVAAAVAGSPALLLPRTARAQEAYPARPIKLIVAFPPGGSSDILGRIVADHMGRLLKGSMFVDNKAGGTTQ